MKRIVALALSAVVSACGAAAPPPPSAPAPAQPSPVAQPAQAPVAYSPYADPGYLQVQNEKNAYSRRILAMLWVASATADPPGPARDARQKQAAQALSEAEAAVAQQGDPCQAGVLAALERATADKSRLEQRYLVVSEATGESSDDAKLIDAQVHVLRDAMEELGALAKPCPPPMFPDSDSEPR